MEEGRIVGHAYFTPVRIEGAEIAWTAMALGPMAVVPDRQRSRIGSKLVKDGLKRCQEIGEPVVFVLGHSEYYPRFGFRPTRPFGIDCTFPVPEEVFLVKELEPDAIAGRSGVVYYHEEFSRMEEEGA